MKKRFDTEKRGLDGKLKPKNERSAKAKKGEPYLKYTGMKLTNHEIKQAAHAS